jgi:hypothetical protein
MAVEYRNGYFQPGIRIEQAYRDRVTERLAR